MTKALDKKNLLEALNKMKEGTEDKNKILLEDMFGHANQHLGSGIYKMKHPEDTGDEEGDVAVADEPQEEKPKEEVPPTSPPKEPEAKPAPKPVEEQKFPENIVFDGDFSNSEKKAILSTSDKVWQPMYKRELLASKDDMLEGFDGNPDFIVRTIDENQKVVFIPYKLFEKLYLRSKEVTLNIKDMPIKFIVMLPKNYDDASMATAYGDDDALVKRNEGDKSVISKMDLSTFNSIFTKEKKQTIRKAEKDLAFTEPKKKQIPKPKLKMVDEMPEPQSLVGKDIIVNTKADTGGRDMKVRVNSFNPTSNKISVNFRKMNFTVPLEYIQKAFVREA